ncbi:hypothetical protein N0V93_007624 [Gnomoniopsis smithogilvyi]|uniref:N-acetyltransferase domain-containing protein n=1 Tax=Gnomoniopsis smithogilvyi TaxID=1191159 RepID=A0A9W8YU36_9PEZI|nr:hypothetical protein N0V93_007624 [Gnomoniopsis smithogilvyi]
MTSLRLWILLSLSTFISSVLPSPQQVPIPGAVPFTFRNATFDDLDDVTTVYVDAFSRAPTWSYIRQFSDMYPNYTWTCQNEMLKKIYLNNSNMGSIAIKVISVPDKQSHRKERVVSISAWELDPLLQATDMSLLSASLAGLGTGISSRPVSSTEPAQKDFDCEAHLDMNMTRALHFQKKVFDGQDKYLLKPYGPQFVLSLLATHPDWDGNGFAAKHLHWGKKALAEMNQAPEHLEHPMPLTLIGTPAGYPLYLSKGFEGVGNITIERLDDKGTLWMEAMKYDGEVD